ncbi:DUF4238 domain-containing protein [Psychrosphaera sp. 1_MG-2023]|uniref:DUF4238 domain-containing protein n=1 Tax=Psychrosphaera sp. 1_MG-2023 TaxID=3062643 RepID=UPI0026E15C62|nr:DUF4238 domain-containing protein [Psychrosphaera sp. 1_MG-2023]MDO6719105.1 DUF4238 domain-containing protein [Psychrosphaera sp. 1_MG-2023]
MSTTRDNHYVPQWYQTGFMEDRDNELRHLKKKVISLPNGTSKTLTPKKWYSPAQALYQKDLYTTFFGSEVNDAIEKKLFGPIDENGSTAVRAFLTDDQAKWHHNFQDFFTYLDAQKLRTPKGLDWIKTKYPELSQLQLMTEMQALRTIHCTLWSEGARELVSATNSTVKFILSDHPVTIYNYACPPNSEICKYPNDPDIALKGTQTIYPLDKNRCLILTNLEYAKDPDNANPLEQRTNATKVRQSMVKTIEFINSRELSEEEVEKINFIIKSRSNESIAAGKDEWLEPEKNIDTDWAELRHILLPPLNELHRFGGEMFAGFEDGSTYYQDAFGRTSPQHDALSKNIDESTLSRNDFCGCGSGRKYKKCCLNVPTEYRTTWSVASIRERNLAFCNCIKDVLNIDKGKTWLDVRRELSNEQIVQIYSFYGFLWPRNTDIYSLLPKSDEKFRGLYSGPLDTRQIGIHALPMASYFDEFLIQNPIVNPNNVNPEFSPIESPEQYKYQALKDFAFMLELEPYIGHGLVNLIPDPGNFDNHLMREMLGMARNRGDGTNIVSESDKKIHFNLVIQDLLNSMHMLPRPLKIRTVKEQFNISEQQATELINALEANAEASPLTMLQPPEGSQLMLSSMGPNYEMALFIAQITGAVIVTDSETRWKEFEQAQCRNLGVASHPWSGIYNILDTIPMDYQMVETLTKSEGSIEKYRTMLRSVDNLILEKINNAVRINNLIAQASEIDIEFDTSSFVSAELKVLSPEGGLIDSNVQRLLVRSGCINYDSSVRSVYFVKVELNKKI